MSTLPMSLNSTLTLLYTPLVPLLTKWNNKGNLRERVPFSSHTLNLTLLKEPQTHSHTLKATKTLALPHLWPKHKPKEPNLTRMIGGDVFVIKALDILHPSILTKELSLWLNTKLPLGGWGGGGTRKGGVFEWLCWGGERGSGWWRIIGNLEGLKWPSFTRWSWTKGDHIPYKMHRGRQSVFPYHR